MTDIVVPIIQPESPPQPNLPLSHLLDGSRENYIKYGVGLYKASIKGNWKAAKAILDEQPYLIRSAITENYETMLHVAASAKRTKSLENFVENLVSLMEAKDIELQNKNYNTALNLAASVGNINTAMIMIKKNPHVLEIPGVNGMMPVCTAALFSKPGMVRYLYSKSKKMAGDLWTNENRGLVLQRCVEANIFDVALDIVHDIPKLIADSKRLVHDSPELTAVSKRLVHDVLYALAQKNSELEDIEPGPDIIDEDFRVTVAVFQVMLPIPLIPWIPLIPKKESQAFTLLRTIWQKIVIFPKTDIDDIIRGPPIWIRNVTKYPERVLFVAAKLGNARFIIELIRSYPDLVLNKNGKEQTIFHIAVKYRHQNIYSLLYEIGSMKEQITLMKDIKGNNLLHFAAKGKLSQNAPGVGLQMQRELLWFKEVEQMVPFNYRQMKNEDGCTAYELFSTKHAELVRKDETWMKDTATQCMVVATLIATISFAAAFTLPGGYDQNTGIPFFKQKPSLVVFVIADAVSLISSSTSILMFLSILTSSFAECDFMESLPRKLVCGLLTLFLSILSMMVAFSASFFILYNNNMQWLPVIITNLAGIPVLVYNCQQYILTIKILHSTYVSRDLFKPERGLLFE